MAVTGDTVTVALKHPTGLRLDLMGDEQIETVNTPMGPMKQARRALLKSIYVRGSADERRLDTANDKGRPIEHAGVATVRGGFGLTSGIAKDFWDAWLAQNRDYPLVVNGLIFASGRNVADAAAEKKEIQGAFEPIDPEKVVIGNTKFEPVYGQAA